MCFCQRPLCRGCPYRGSDPGDVDTVCSLTVTRKDHHHDVHVGWKLHLRAYRDIEGQCALGHMEGEGLDTKSSRLDDELKKNNIIKC